jgi:zinc protease
MELVGLMLREPRLEAAEVEKARTEQLRAIAQGAASPSAVARQLFGHALYADHPLGLSPRGTEASVKAITVDELRAFHREYMAPAQLIVTVVTDLAPDAVVKLAADALGGAWEATAPRPLAPPRPVRGVHTEEKTLGSTQSQIRLGNLAAVKRQRSWPTRCSTTGCK